MIDLASLVALKAVDSNGSVIAAADALGFTPSAVSQQVKRLERQVGVPLLERVGRGVILTGPGRQLVDDGSRLLSDLEEIEAGLHRTAATVAGHLRIAAFSTAVRGLIAPAVGEALREHPGLSLTITEHEPWTGVDLVATGHADLGVVHSWGDVPVLVPEHLVATFLAHDVADVVVAADHPLATRRRVTPRDLLDVGWIATPEGTICRQWLNRMYDGTGHLPRIAHVSQEFDSHLAMVGAGLGVALVPRLGRAPLAPDVVAIPAHEPVPTREISVLHRRSMAASPAVRAVVEALTRTAGQPSDRSARRAP
jgi:DNA-binding transcriptional LysR family regulator